MTARRTWPRQQAQHESAAADALQRYIWRRGWEPVLPVPVSDIVETVYDLKIIWEPIAEPPGETILGALSPKTRIIQMNERHISFFENWVGPEAFTLAHELGHWVYDAVAPEQGQLFDTSGEPVFCRRAEAVEAQGADIREVNANKFASCLLLPVDLLKAALAQPFPTWSALGAAAAAWGVSKTTLRIRLETVHMEWAIP